MSFGDFLLDQLRRSRVSDIAEQAQRGEIQPQDINLKLMQALGDQAYTPAVQKQAALQQIQGMQNIPFEQQVAQRESLGLISPEDSMTLMLGQQKQSALTALAQEEEKRKAAQQDYLNQLRNQQLMEDQRHNQAMEQRGFIDPNTGMPVKKETAQDKAFAQADVKQLTELSQSADDAQRIFDLGDRLLSSQKGVFMQGPIAGRLTPDWSEAAQVANTITEELALRFKGMTTGAISNDEMRGFRKATPSLNMTEQANQTIINNMKAVAARKQQQSDFFNMWNVS